MPLVISIGLSRKDVLASFDAEVVRIVGSGAVATVLIGLLLLLLAWEEQRRRAREKALAISNAALAEAEASFRGIIESSPDYLIVLRVDRDDELTVEFMNTATIAARGIGSDHRGKPSRSIVPAQTFARADRIVREVVKTGRTIRQEENCFDDERICDLIVVPLSFNKFEQKVSRVFVSIRDISHLRRAEVAIAASEVRYRLLADNTTDMITHMDLTGRRLFISPASRDLLGYSSEELVGTSPHQMIHPEDAKGLQGIFIDFAAGRLEKFVNINRLRHRDGRWIWVEASLKLLRDKSGKPSSVVGAMRDITERRQAEIAIETSETRFRLLAENVSELIILAKDDGALSYISPASHRLLGYTPEELRRTVKPSAWVHPDDIGQIAAAALGKEVLESGFLLRLRRKDGAWIWAEAVFGRISEARDGEPTIVATFRDVSARQTEAEALRQAKKAAEQASQAKTDFLAAMSHEIRTPLNAVLGYADLLLSDVGIAGERRLGLERIQNAGSALRTVVDDILDFSKIEAGQIDLVPQPFRLGQLIENVLSILGASARSKGLDLVVDLGVDVPSFVVGDHDRLRQILLNLLNNAIKFTAAGSVTLAIRALGREAEAVKIRFSVEDTGIGISQDQLAKLFQRFSQVDGSISRQFGGTGLGLAISKHLVEIMGGEVGVSSRLERGSLFWFDVTLPTNATLTETTSAKRVEASCARSMAILLVEDHEINRDLARAVLEASGHEVDAVDNGAAAVAAVISRRYDVVLMDVQMPLMDGIEATRRIRKLDHPDCQVPIIAMTANVLPSQLAEFEQAGMDGHVGKPFRRDELLAAVLSAVDQVKLDLLREHSTSSPILDLDVFSSLSSVVGYEAVRSMLSRTLEQLGTISVDVDRETLASLAHGLMSAAGTLGLVDLFTRLRDVESACVSGDTTTHVLQEFQSSLARAQDEVTKLEPALILQSGAAA